MLELKFCWEKPETLQDLQQSVEQQTSQLTAADLHISPSDEPNVTAAAFVMTLSLPLFVPRSSNFRFNTEFCQLERFSDDFTIVCRDTQGIEKGSRVA